MSRRIASSFAIRTPVRTASPAIGTISRVRMWSGKLQISPASFRKSRDHDPNESTLGAGESDGTDARKTARAAAMRGTAGA